VGDAVATPQVSFTGGEGGRAGQAPPAESPPAEK